jgi:hypothetical protein
MEVIVFRGTERAAVSSSSAIAIDVAPRRSVAYLAASSCTRVTLLAHCSASEHEESIRHHIDLCFWQRTCDVKHFDD